MTTASSDTKDSNETPSGSEGIDTGAVDRISPKPTAAEKRAMEKVQHAKEIRRGEALGISGAAKMKRADLQAELANPDFQSSNLERDTTHFDNVHHAAPEDLRFIGAGSSLDRQLTAQSALSALGYNVNPGGSWADSEAGVATFQADHDLEPTGTFDRKTWDALGDELFPS